MNKEHYNFVVKSSASPVVEWSPDGLYVMFKPGAKAAKTIVRRRWPVIAVDVDKDGDVIGVECAPAPARFSIAGLAKDAGIRVPKEAAARAEFQNIETLQAAAC